MSMKPQWNYIVGENRRTWRKTCPSATVFATNPTWIDPGVNLSLSNITAIYIARIKLL
jgi:hypothetical protein